MSDIVEKLKDIASVKTQYSKDLIQAADEIERLRAALITLRANSGLSSHQLEIIGGALGSDKGDNNV